MEKNTNKNIKKKQIDDDILSIVKGFIDYFEHVNDTDAEGEDNTHGNSF